MTLVEEFLNDLLRRGYSHNTIRTYQYALKNLKNCDIKQTTASDLMQILSQDWKPNTVAARQAALKSFFKWLKDNNKIQQNPAEVLGAIRLPESLPRPIPQHDLEKIFGEIKNLSLDLRTYFWLLRDLGLRASEGINLDVDDIYWEKGQESIRVSGKGNRERIIPFDWSMGCTPLLKRLCRQQKTGPLFISNYKKRATYYWAYYWWNRLMEQTDLHYTIHQLRHTAISRWVRAGMNLMAIRCMAGHKLFSTTERYAEVTNEDLRRKIQYFRSE